MTILEMLDKLSQIAPDVCKKRIGNRYDIREYHFLYHKDWFMGTLNGVSVYGRPALAWLADAIQGECEKRGWDYKTRREDGRHYAVITLNDRKRFGNGHSQAESLLAAFIVAIEGER